MFEYFDSHCDTITTCLDSCQEINENICHIDLKRGKFFKHFSQIFSIWVDDDTRGEAAVKRFLQVYDFFISQTNKFVDQILFCKNQKDYEQARRQKKVTAFLSIEGGQAFGGHLENIEKFYELGVRMTTLTWNGENELGCGCMCGSTRGLTPYGKEAVSQMKALGMIIDVSHLNETGFWDVMEIGGHIVASHSNAKAICSHKRNLTDEQYLALVKNGGGAGINIYTPFIGKEATLDRVIDHIEHFWSLGGENHLFIGADYDGIDSTLPELEDVTGMEKLYNRLLQKNYPEGLLHKLFYQNLEAIIMRAL
jgi:membrane dipeptidase